MNDNLYNDIIDKGIFITRGLTILKDRFQLKTDPKQVETQNWKYTKFPKTGSGGKDHGILQETLLWYSSLPPRVAIFTKFFS